jgi:hypothetical protein
MPRLPPKCKNGNAKTEMSQQSEKFLFQQSRKFLLKSVKLAG